jgi:hypothetical protein
VKPGESHLQVNAGGDRGFSSIHDETFTLKSAEVKDLRIELHWVDVTLVVKDADGRAVVGANVNGSRSKGADDAESTGDRFGVWEQTDSEGKASVSLAKEGTWDFNVRSDEGSTAHVKVDVRAKASPVRSRSRSTRECAAAAASSSRGRRRPRTATGGSASRWRTTRTPRSTPPPTRSTPRRGSSR